MGRDVRPYAPGHDAGDTYELQELVKGTWLGVCKVSKASATPNAKSCANRTGNPHRVVNLTKNRIYVEVEPR